MSHFAGTVKCVVAAASNGLVYWENVHLRLCNQLCPAKCRIRVKAQCIDRGCDTVLPVQEHHASQWAVNDEHLGGGDIF
jgi:hypothetical protein